MFSDSGAFHYLWPFLLNHNCWCYHHMNAYKQTTSLDTRPAYHAAFHRSHADNAIAIYPLLCHAHPSPLLYHASHFGTTALHILHTVIATHHSIFWQLQGLQLHFWGGGHPLDPTQNTQSPPLEANGQAYLIWGLGPT